MKDIDAAIDKASQYNESIGKGLQVNGIDAEEIKTIQTALRIMKALVEEEGSFDENGLLPCPHCANAEINMATGSFHVGGLETKTAICNVCGARSQEAPYPSKGYCDTEQDAIDRATDEWNNRTTESQKILKEWMDEIRSN